MVTVAIEMRLVPARHGFERDVRVTGDHRSAGEAVSSGHDPVIAAGPFGIAGRLADRPPRPGRRIARQVGIGFGWDYRLLVRLAEQEIAIERSVSEYALRQFGHDDHRESAGEVPTELALDGQAVDWRPRLGSVVEQVELDRQSVTALLDPRVDTRRECLQDRPRLARQPLEFLAGDPVQADHSRDDVHR